MGTTHRLPTLQTLQTKPSWHNRAGRVDRSACFVLTASKHWRAIPEGRWTYRLGLPPSEHWRLDQPKPASDVRGIKGLCDRYADLTLWARDLWELHRWEPPYPLQGDFRTAKSNALKVGTGAQWMREDRTLGTGPINPNRGVGFKQYKMLGLPADWSTTLRIERIFQHEKLRQHFFVCPVCGPRKFHNSKKEIAATLRVAGQITRPAGRSPAAIPNARIPALPGRVTKLYLPLCTPQERADARVAQLWLRAHSRNITHPNRPLTPEESQLIQRYSVLFEPRQLRCRQCLGLRYGEVKPSSASLSRRERAGVRGRPPVEQQRCIPTEQTLFLQNLPKLLTRPEFDRRENPTPGNALPGLPMGEHKSKVLAEGQMNQSSIKNHQSNQAQLLAEFCQLQSSFKRLAKVKELAN